MIRGKLGINNAKNKKGVTTVSNSTQKNINKFLSDNRKLNDSRNKTK